MLNILGKRYLFFLLSAVIIVPGIVGLLVWGLPLSIDFTGGSLFEVQFSPGKAPSPSSIIKLYNDAGIKDVQVQTTGEDIRIIRSTEINEIQQSKLIQEFNKRYNDTVTIRRFENVGATVGKEVANRAFFAVLIAAIAVILYITFAFRSLPHAFRYGLCAIIAMVHDTLVVISISVLGGYFLGWQIDSLFLTGILTVIGFSVQDKIVVFDRIRENSGIFRKLQFEKLANHSIIQTLQRSINTQLMTSEFLLLSLALIGGVTLRQFSIILLIGLFMGTYSSIFIAAPILVVWEKKEWQSWFRKKEIIPG